MKYYKVLMKYNKVLMKYNNGGIKILYIGLNEFKDKLYSQIKYLKCSQGSRNPQWPLFT